VREASIPEGRSSLHRTVRSLNSQSLARPQALQVPANLCLLSLYWKPRYVESCLPCWVLGPACWLESGLEPAPDWFEQRQSRVCSP
jgi:hypothetical protein